MPGAQRLRPQPRSGRGPRATRRHRVTRRPHTPADPVGRPRHHTYPSPRRLRRRSSAHWAGRQGAGPRRRLHCGHALPQGARRRHREPQGGDQHPTSVRAPRRRRRAGRTAGGRTRQRAGDRRAGRRRLPREPLSRHHPQRGATQSPGETRIETGSCRGDAHPRRATQTGRQGGSGAHEGSLAARRVGMAQRDAQGRMAAAQERPLQSRSRHPARHQLLQRDRGRNAVPSLPGSHRKRPHRAHASLQGSLHWGQQSPAPGDAAGPPLPPPARGRHSHHDPGGDVVHRRQTHRPVARRTSARPRRARPR